MQKNLIVLLFVFALLWSSACDTPKNESNPNAQTQISPCATLEHQVDSLTNLVQKKDTLLSYFLMTFIEIQQNLNKINSKKAVVLQISLTASPESDISEIKAAFEKYIQEVSALLKENNEKIANLHETISLNKMEINELNSAIGSFEVELLKKNQEITQLKSTISSDFFEIASLESIISNLNEEFKTMGATIKQQQELLNTAWYCVADKKTLLNNTLISKNGKVLSIESSMTTQININETKEIPVHARKITVLTSHPLDSYSIIENGDNVEKIVINNASNFWSISKYCVIQTRN